MNLRRWQTMLSRLGLSAKGGPALPSAPSPRDDTPTDGRTSRLGWEIERLVEALSQRDQALTQAHRRAQAYLDIVGVMVVMLNAKGNVVLVNRKAAEVLGCSSERPCLGRNWFDCFLAQEDHAASRTLFQRFMAGQSDADEFIENHLVTLSGERLLVAWHNRVMHGHTGRVVGMLCAGEDITLARQTRQALQYSEERLRMAQEAAGVGAWELDTRTGQLSWSPECERLYGVPPGSIQRHEDWLRLLHPEDQARIQAMNTSLSVQSGVFEAEFRTRNADGEPRWILAKGRSMADASGQITRLVGINLDITERKRMQEEQLRLQAQLQQAQKMESLGQLTGGIAHDFNNILASVLGFARLALRRHAPDPSSELAEFLREIITSGERARDLVAKMLAFGRSQPGQGNTPLAPVPLVKEALKMLSAAMPASIRIDTRFETGVSDIAIDPVSFHQILVNLVINARDAIGEKGVIHLALRPRRMTQQTCSTCHERFSGDFVELEVSDTGHGITADNLPRIFEPFFTTKEVGKGTGMGLSMVHGLVRNAGGHFQVKSQPGAGATFHVYLPIARTPEAPVPQPAPLLAEPVVTTSKGKVLLVDDEAAILRLLAATLRAEGWQVSTFEHPQAALAAFVATPSAFDAVITDQAMPDMTGVELIQALHAVRPDLPVLLCTGYSEHLNEALALQLGASGFFMKPVDSDLLATTLDAVTRHAKETSAP